MSRILGLAARVATVALMLASTMALPSDTAMASHVQCGDVITENTVFDADLIDCPSDGILIGASNVTLDLRGHTIDGIGWSFSHRPYGVVADIERLIEIGWPGPLPAELSRVTVTNGSIREFASGVTLENVAGGVIRRLDVTDTLIGGIYANWSPGIRIESNTLTRSWIGLSSTREPVVVRNRVTSGSISTNEASQGLIAHNVISDATTGISLSQGSDNVIVDNTVSRSQLGIRANDYRTRVARNLVYSNAGDGIWVDCCAVTVVGNTALWNGDDGIDVGFGSDGFAPNFVSRNTANDNGDLGIEAAPGVTDGGRNRARRNGNPAQCVGVVCKSRP